MQRVLAATHLSKALEHEPTLIVELVRLSIDTLVVEIVQDLLSRQVLDAAPLQTLRDAAP